MSEKEWFTKEEIARKKGYSIKTIERKIGDWKAKAKANEIKRLIQQRGKGGKLHLHKELVESNFTLETKTQAEKPTETKETDDESKLAVELRDRIGDFKTQIKEKDEQIKGLLEGQRELRILIASQERHYKQIEGQNQAKPTPIPKTTQPKAQIDSLAIIIGAIIIGISLVLTMLIAGR